VNIAFVNELSMFFEKLGIDTFTVLNAAKSKYNFQVHYPGAGVGGPCLPVNSYQLLNSAKTLGDNNMLSMIKNSRKVNEHMPDHVIKLIQDVFYESNKEISNGTIMILGISYKPNVKDIQLTPAEQIIKKLQSFGVKIKIFDPFYKNEKVFDITVENNLFENLSECDGLVIVTNHDEFSSIDLKLLSSKMKFPIVIDSRGLIQKNDAEKAGLIFRGLGQ
jgi:nucleotide sugar dehydrogenase